MLDMHIWQIPKGDKKNNSTYIIRFLDHFFESKIHNVFI